MELTFWGAAQQVTGSMHLLDVNGFKILIDCGLDYEKESTNKDNENFPFDPQHIDLVILTHAHIDHSGNLPTLVRLGYEGQILSTPPTADLTNLLLTDSVNIFLSKHNGRKNGKRRGKPTTPPLYLQKHVVETMERFVTISFHRKFKINGSIELEFIPVGHILGAAAVVLTIDDQGIKKTIGFTGDVGRKNYPVLQDPEPLPPLDYLVSESTYGGRFHSNQQTLEQKLTEVITDTCVKSPGRLIIPAFSIGRTQSLVFTLNKLFTSGLVPPVKVFVDSPLANNATTVYRKYPELLSEDSREFYRARGDEFTFDNLEYIQNMQESRKVANYLEPCIIISSAGMLEGGRIQDHLFYNIQNYYCTILFIGYCAKGTLGHRLLRGDSIVHMRDRELSVFASIKQTDLLSGHADHKGLMEVINGQPSSLKKVFLVHGDIESQQALAAALETEGRTVYIPEKGEYYTI